jgi:hypothetical protein
VAVADAVIIPVRASIFDIGAITCAVEMCKERRKPYAFVLSAVDKPLAFPLQLLDDRLLQPKARLALGDVLRQRLLDLRGGLEVEVLYAASGAQASPINSVGCLPLPRPASSRPPKSGRSRP